MKRFVKYTAFAALLCMVLCICVSANFTLDVSYLYSEPETVVVTTEQELEAFRDGVNNGSIMDANVLLEADIELTKPWIPIGTEANPFSGTFDGNGHSISGLSITAGYTYSGLFGYVSVGQIKELELVSPSIAFKSSIESVNANVGFVVGKAASSKYGADVVVNDIRITGGTINVKSAQSVYAGGIVGYAEGINYGVVTIYNCYVQADITCESSNKAAFAGLGTGDLRSRSANASTIYTSVFEGSCNATAKLSAVAGLITANGFANGTWASAPVSAQLSADEESVAILAGCIASGTVSTNASVNSYSGSIYGSLSGAATQSNCYYTPSTAVSVVKGQSTASGTYNGKIITDINFLYSEDFVYNTVGLEKYTGWLVNTDKLPTQYLFEDGYYPIEVKKGSKAYLQDGTRLEISRACNVYAEKSADGYVNVVNGMSQQSVYNVSDGQVQKNESLENGVITLQRTQLRPRDNSVRFICAMTESAKENDNDEIVEYGFILAVDDGTADFSEGFELDFDLVQNGKATVGVAYSKENNVSKIFEIDDVNGLAYFTCVAFNIPQTKEGLTSKIYIRPYYRTHGGNTVLCGIYGNDVYTAALAIKNQNGSGYAENASYFDNIISTVQAVSE